MVYDLKYSDSMQLPPARRGSLQYVQRFGRQLVSFSTMGKGVYRLNSSVALNVQLSENWQVVQSGERPFVTKDVYQASNTFNLIKKYDRAGWEMGRSDLSFTWYQHLPNYSALTLKDNSVILGSGLFFEKDVTRNNAADQLSCIPLWSRRCTSMGKAFWWLPTKS